MDVQIKFTLEIILYHMRSWWIMADDNWSAKTYSIQFQAKETSNQSNCVISTLSNDDLTYIEVVVIFGAHTSKSLARSLPPSGPLSLPDYSHIHSRINLGLHSFTPIIAHIRLFIWLFALFITHPLTYSSVHSFAQKFALSLNYSHLHVITQSYTYSPHSFFTHYPIIHTFT